MDVNEWVVKRDTGSSSVTKTFGDPTPGGQQTGDRSSWCSGGGGGGGEDRLGGVPLRSRSTLGARTLTSIHLVRSPPMSTLSQYRSTSGARPGRTSCSPGDQTRG